MSTLEQYINNMGPLWATEFLNTTKGDRVAKAANVVITTYLIFEGAYIAKWFISGAMWYLEQRCISKVATTSQVVKNNQVGNSFDTYVEGTILKGVDKQGLLETQREFSVLNIEGRASVRPDYTIYNKYDAVAAIADAKSGTIAFDAQAKGFIQIAQQTASKTLIYYVPKSVTLPREMLSAARISGVRIITVVVK